MAAVTLAIVTACMAIMRPSIGFDPARGLLASEQRLQGRSNPLSEMVVADPADIDRDKLVPVSWWPPGQQAVIYLLRRAGLSIGQSIKAVVLFCWVIGIAAWSRYFAVTLANEAVLPFVVGGFALLRASHFTGFEYLGGETLLWAIVPVLTLIHLASVKADAGSGIALAAVSGFVAGALVLVKYSGAIVALGFAAAWIVSTLRGDVARARVKTAVWLLAAAISTGMSYFALKTSLAGPLPVDAHASHPLAATLAFSIAGPLVAVSDLTSMLSTWSVRNGLDVPSDALIGWFSAGLSVALLAWWGAAGHPFKDSASRATARPAWRLALSVTALTSVVLAMLILRGGRISFEGRHLQYGGFLLLPFLIDAASGVYRSARGVTRAMTLVLAGILLIVPVVYGAGGLAVHLRKQFTQRNALTDTGIVLDWTRDGAGAERFRREILSLPAFDRTLLVTPTPAIALAFPSTRVLIAFDGPSSVTEHYRGTATGGVTFVAAPWLAESAVEFVKGQFVDVHSWSRVALKSVPGAHVWQGH